MRRESHVRFCEGAGVRFPRATRLREYSEVLGQDPDTLHRVAKLCGDSPKLFGDSPSAVRLTAKTYAEAP